MATHEPTSVRRTVGRYKILGTLGQGGMGYLYLARAEGPGGFERLAALKMIHEHLSREPAFVEMFLEEARIAARIHHPNVVTVYEIGEQQGRYFIAMDYIHGETLHLTLSRRWKSDLGYPFAMAAHIVAAAAEGLHQAHELRDLDGQPWNVVHRDVTPGNIMIGYDGTVRVMDFGIAKAAGRLNRTAPGMHKGKAPYMAPEQIRDEVIDRRVDIFALGIVLWETTIGKHLFKGSNDLATINRISSGQVPAPSTMRPGYPVELERIVLKALANKREDRYPTARALAEDLRLFMSSHSRMVSAVDVEQFMRETFPDRYAARLSMEKLATAPETRGQSNEPIPRDAPKPTVARQLEALISEELADQGLDVTSQITPPAKPPLRDEPQPTTNPEQERDAAFVEVIPPARRSRAKVMMLGGALLGIGLVIGGIESFGGKKEEAVAAPPPPIVAQTPPEPTPPPLARVAMTFAVTPADARVEVDGQTQRGTFVTDRSDHEYEVRISAPNHEPMVMRLTGDRSQHIEVALKPQDEPVKKSRRSSSSSKKRSSQSKEQKPPDGLVDEGEL